ncbi:MAG: GNAT family N-acetyltransferase [Thermoplasmata archaeon]|nr:GNAT family N-acetyltransferase [Thermoplasmata archaeon]
MVEYRNVSTADLHRITSVLNQSRKGIPFQRKMTADEVAAETVDDEDFDPSGAWLALSGGKAIAYGEAFIAHGKLELGKKEGYAKIEVSPEYRGNGVEEELVRRAESYMVGKGIMFARASSTAEDDWRINLLRVSGYQMVRVFNSMLAKNVENLVKISPPEGCELDGRLLTDCSDEEIELFADIVTETFKGQFNYEPYPPSRLMNIRDTSQDTFRVTYASVDGNCVGAFLTEDSMVLNREREKKEGWILLGGVREGHRGRGIGRALIADGVNWLVTRGIENVYIGVDTENPTAFGLYQSLGFEVQYRNMAYGKSLRC